MNARQHALLARQLIHACGGVNEIVANQVGRLRKPSQLHRFGDPNAGCFMPADTIEDLEAYCGQPLYSRELAASRPCAEDPAGVMREASRLTCAAAELLRRVDEALEDGVLTPIEKTEIDQLLNALEAKLRSTRAANERGAP